MNSTVVLSPKIQWQQIGARAIDVVLWLLPVPLVVFTHALAGLKVSFADGHMLMNDQAVLAIRMQAFGADHPWLLIWWAAFASMICLAYRPTTHALAKRSLVYWAFALPLIWYINDMSYLVGKIIE